MLRPEPAPEAGYYYRSDHFSLARVGVPMLYPKLGEDLVDGGPAAGRAAAQDYRANRYHQPSDEYNPAWNWTGAIHDLQIFYVIARQLADTATGRTGTGRRVPRHPRQVAGGAVTARQPPEWAPHGSVWIGFPSHAELVEDDLEPAREEVAAFAEAVLPAARARRSGWSPPTPTAAAARRWPVREAIVEQAFGDIWLRDTGPLILMDDRSRVAALRLQRLGRQISAAGRRQRSLAAARRDDRPRREPRDWILEGGAIDVDGTGLVVTTEQCLLNPNRNPGMDRTEVAARLGRDLGFERLLWLGDGLHNDHTDGHVDNLARFVAGAAGIPTAARTIPMPRSGTTPAAIGRCRGSNVSRCPRRVAVDRTAKSSPATYMNFYIGNAAVVVPLYGAANDEAAVELIGASSPAGRRWACAPTMS